MLRVWNDAQTALSNAASVGSLFSEVHPDAAVRDRAEAVAQQVQKLDTDLGLDTELYAVLAGARRAAASTPTRPACSSARCATSAASGVDRDEATRDRLRELSERAILLSQEFSKNIREDVRSIRRRARAARRAAAGLGRRPPGRRRRPRHGDDRLPRRRARSAPSRATREARRDLVTEFLTIAWPANDRVLQEIFAVRREHAALLGYDVVGRLRRRGEDDRQRPGHRRVHRPHHRAVGGRAPSATRPCCSSGCARTVPTPTDIDGADVSYYAELVRKEQLAVDAQQVRTYFPFESVRQGLLDVTGRLFGLEWSPVAARGRRARGTTRSRPTTCRFARRAHRPHLPRPAPARGQVQARGPVRPRPRRRRHAARRGRARLQLQPRPDGARRGRHALPRVRPPRAPRARPAAPSGCGSRASRPSGTSSRRRARCSRSGRGTPTCSRPSPATATASRSPPSSSSAMRRADDFGKGYDARTQMFYAALSYDFHVQERRRPHGPPARAAGALLRLPVPAGHAHAVPLRAPRRLQLGLLHLHVVARHRQGHVLGLRPR